MDLVKLVQDYAAAISGYPPDVRGQQRHFASVLPAKRQAVEDALVLAFSSDELLALGEVLAEILRERGEPIEVVVEVDTGEGP